MDLSASTLSAAFEAAARAMPLGKSATVSTVMTVTAWSAGLCFLWQQGATQMYRLHTFESLRTAAVFEERNDDRCLRPCSRSS